VAAAASLAVAALAACGTHGSAQGSTDLAHAPSASFIQQARLVSARWARSPAGRARRTGLVLVGSPAVTPIPGNAGFNSQRQKAMFLSGHFRLATTLPDRRLGGVVRCMRPDLPLRR